MTLLTSFKVVW